MKFVKHVKTKPTPMGKRHKMTYQFNAYNEPISPEERFLEQYNSLLVRILNTQKEHEADCDRLLYREVKDNFDFYNH